MPVQTRAMRASRKTEVSSPVKRRRKRTADEADKKSKSKPKAKAKAKPKSKAKPQSRVKSSSSKPKPAKPILSKTKTSSLDDLTIKVKKLKLQPARKRCNREEKDEESDDNHNHSNSSSQSSPTPPTKTKTRKSKSAVKSSAKAPLSRQEKLQHLHQKLLTQEHDDQIVGRDTEYATIHDFISQQLSLKQGNSFYLCGSPGTGKSATMLRIRQHFNSNKGKRGKSNNNVKKIVTINGMRISNPLDIYSILYSEIVDSNKSRNKSRNKSKTGSVAGLTAKAKLENVLMTEQSKMYILIVDEMDGLLECASNQQPLYDLFSWTKRKHCKLILIGIANSIDLVDRFLPRLRQREFDVTMLIFQPYNKQQMIDIVQHRLGEDCNLFFDEIAIKLCSQKVAKMYGDVRKLLEVVRNALNVLIADEAKQKIGFMEMKKILVHSFESPMVEIMRNLPNQQKTIMVVACIWMDKRKQKFVLYNQLQRFYGFMAKKHMMQTISSREFSVIIDSLVSDRIVKIVDPKNKKGVLENDTKMQITPKIQDIQHALKDETVLSKFFEMDIVLPRKFIG